MLNLRHRRVFAVFLDYSYVCYQSQGSLAKIRKTCYAVILMHSASLLLALLLLFAVVEEDDEEDAAAGDALCLRVCKPLWSAWW